MNDREIVCERECYQVNKLNTKISRMWIVIVGIAICVITSLLIIIQYNWRSQVMFENWNAVAAEYKNYLRHKIVADSLEQAERRNNDLKYYNRP